MQKQHHPPFEITKSPELTTHGTETNDTGELVALKSPRAGRKPMFDEQTWREVVMAWEQRDTAKSPITLADFLAEKMGRRPDGSPVVPITTFYGWRRKFAMK